MAILRGHHWGLLAAAAGAGGLIYWLAAGHRTTLAPEPPAAVAVATALVTRGDVPVAITELGAAQSWQAVTIRAQVSGRLQQVAVQEGSDVRAGDLIALIDPAPYQAVLLQAQGTLRRDQAQLAIAKLDLDRYGQLTAENLISRQQIDAQRALVEELSGTVLSDQGAVDAAQVNLGYCRISSPVTGRVGVRLLDAGNLVSAIDTGGIITINQLVPIAVTFSVPQADFQQLSQASDAFRHPLGVQATSQDSDALIATGVLVVADNHVDAASGTVALKARFDNTERRLWPGQFVNVSVTLRVLPGAITMPVAAVNRGPGPSFAYVIGADHTAQMRPIAVESVQGRIAIIRSGVQPGERVVVDGQMSLRPGMPVIVSDAGVAAAAAGAAARGPAAP
jgi:multidrug efflux system membrane fusion protein